MDRSISYALEKIACSTVVLKAEHATCIKCIYEGKDVFLWLPTGFGKSLCYEVLPFLFDDKLGKDSSVVIVVSPLISLMVDQVQSLRRRSVRAAIMSSGSKVDKEFLATDDDIRDGRLFFCAPEAIDVSRWRDAIAKPEFSSRVVAIVVDEAHCVSKWYVCMHAHYGHVSNNYYFYYYLIHRSRDFRPSYGRLHELRALIPKGTPLLACTATVTHGIRKEVIESLEMSDCKTITTSPDRPNIYYEVHARTDMETDLNGLVVSLKQLKNMAPRVIVYCRALDVCADLYAHFHFELGDGSYYPPGAERVSDNRLFGMFHANTPQHNKEVVLSSLTRPDGVVRVVFATVALGMGINLRDVNTIIHYGAPQSIENYFQESGRGGRSGDPARSIVYWKPIDCRLKKKLASTRDHEVAAVRYYLENDTFCRRQWLLHYFDTSFTTSVQDPLLCCDVCARKCASLVCFSSYIMYT